MANRRRNRRGRSGVMQLNRGSSSFGRSSSLDLNKPGGTFGAGRPSGGGAGAGAVERALAGGPPGLSVAGDIQDVGPPPVVPGPFVPGPAGQMPQMPSFPTGAPAPSQVQTAQTPQIPMPYFPAESQSAGQIQVPQQEAQLLSQFFPILAPAPRRRTGLSEF